MDINNDSMLFCPVCARNALLNNVTFIEKTYSITLNEKKSWITKIDCTCKNEHLFRIEIYDEGKKESVVKYYENDGKKTEQIIRRD